MEVVNLLEFLNKTKSLHALEYATCDSRLVNFLDLISVDEQFTQKIDLGLIFYSEKTLDHFVIIDGLARLVSLSLLLHAVCECYKKTSPKNDNAIRTIRTKYLLDGTRTKVRLPKNLQVIYEKILYGERLSGKEKETPMFKLLHSFWTQIKEDKLQASYIFKMLQKITVTLVETGSVNYREVYYSINNDRGLNQLNLIDNYVSELKTNKEWESIKAIYQNKERDIVLFFKDFFQSKFNYKEFDSNRLYEYFENYCKTMRAYMKPKAVFEQIHRYALLYSDLLNVKMPNEVLRQAMIDIKMLEGEDTYAYLLNVYADYVDGSISEATFVEILSTIKEYLHNRKETPNNVSFNELISYLNAFLACK